MHSKNLEDTELWKAYKTKINSEDRRSLWVKEIYGAAANYLLDVRKTFPNYTLHDETHILNVLEAMGGLLGDQISLVKWNCLYWQLLCTIWEWFIQRKKRKGIIKRKRRAVNF